MVGTEPKPFGFIVHPLTPMQRRLLGVRSADIPLALGAPRGRRHVHTISHLKLAALSGHTQRGILVSVPALPKELLEDQEYGLMLLREAIEVCRVWRTGRWAWGSECDDWWPRQASSVEQPDSDHNGKHDDGLCSV